jgi:DNA helicase-2/ATP-dependent DNA helicase PcrA
MTKDQVVEEIRVAALQKALAAGGNEDDFNEAWYAAHSKLLLRYDAAIAAPPKSNSPPQPEKTYKESKAEDEITEPTLIDGVYYLPKKSDVLYIAITRAGVVFCYYWLTPENFNYIKTLGSEIYKNPPQNSPIEYFKWNNKTRKHFNVGRFYGKDKFRPTLIGSEGLAYCTMAFVDICKKDGKLPVHLVGSFAAPINRVPLFGAPILMQAPAAEQETEIMPAQINNPLLALPAAARHAEARRRIAEFERKTGKQMSEYQRDVIEFILSEKDNVFVEAVAGSGKSTTLLWCAEFIKDFAERQIIISFNRSIAESNGKRLAQMGSPMESMTMHKLGLLYGVAPAIRASTDISKYINDYKELSIADVVAETMMGVKGGSLDFIAYDDFNSTDRDEARAEAGAKLDALSAFQDTLLSAFRIATCTLTDIKNIEKLTEVLSYYKVDITGFTVQQIAQGIEKMLEADFTNLVQYKEIGTFDMIYWGAVGRFPMKRYDIIFVDEAQDLSADQVEFVKNISRRGARIIFVGDRNQAIYGWRGADTSAVDNVVKNFECKLLPLSICYRCPVSVIKFAQDEVPRIEARPNAPEGEIVYIDDTAITEFAKIEGMRPKVGDLVLCRKNAPLARIAMRIIQTHAPTVVMADKAWGLRIQKYFKRALGFIKKERGENYLFSKYAEYMADFLKKELDFMRSMSKQPNRETARMVNISEFSEFIVSVFTARQETDKPFLSENELSIYIFGVPYEKAETAILSSSKGRKPATESIDDGPLLYLNKSTESRTPELRQNFVVCSSIHKAKGDESDTVWWYGPDEHDLSKQSQTGVVMAAWQKIEESNLRYVAKTRAMQRLVMVKDTRKAAANERKSAAAAVSDEKQYEALETPDSRKTNPQNESPTRLLARGYEFLDNSGVPMRESLFVLSKMSGQTLQNIRDYSDQKGSLLGAFAFLQEEGAIVVDKLGFSRFTDKGISLAAKVPKAARNTHKGFDLD